MEIKLAHLGLMFSRICEEYMRRGVDSVKVDDMDEYWKIGAPEWSNFQSLPEPAVGSLSDDWGELQKLLGDEERMPTAVDLDRMAAVLMAVSQRLSE